MSSLMPVIDSPAAAVQYPYLLSFQSHHHRLTNGIQQNTSSLVTQCHDLFQFKRLNKAQVSFVVPFVIAAIMLLLLLTILIWTCISLIKVRQLSKSSTKKNWKFGYSRIAFYVLLIMYAVGRAQFFLLRIIFGGYNEQLTMRDTEMDTRERTVTNSLLFMISFQIYYYASLCYYSAFTMLCIDWAQYLMYTYGIGIEFIKKTLRKSTIFITLGNGVIHTVGWIFIVLSIVLCYLYRTIHVSDPDVYSILRSVYLSWHLLTIAGFVTFIVRWYFYVRSRLQWDGRLPVMSNFNFRQTRKIQLATTVISVLIALKSLWCLSLLILGVIHHGLCIDSQFVLIAIVDVLCDCVPILIVLIYLTPSLRKSSTTKQQQALQQQQQHPNSYSYAYNYYESDNHSDTESEDDHLKISIVPASTPTRVIEHSSRRPSNNNNNNNNNHTQGTTNNNTNKQQHGSHTINDDISPRSPFAQSASYGSVNNIFSFVADDQSRMIRDEYFPYQTPAECHGSSNSYYYS